MAILALVLLGLVALSGCDARTNRRFANAKFAVGGATSANSIISGLLAGACKSVAKGQVYQSVGSGDGIKAFNNGTYVIGISDTSMSPVEDTTGISLTNKKFTLPLILARYSFFISGVADGAVSLTAQDAYDIFKSGKQKKKASKYAPVSRSESSGTTFVIKRYFKVAAVTGIAADLKDPTFYSTKPFPSTWKASKITAPGSKDVCTEAAKAKNRITYAQVGVCNTVAAGATGEVKLRNKAGTFVLASQTDASQGIPRSLPTPTASWNSVPDSMILVTGGTTPPIVSFIYGFIRAKGLAAAGPLGATGKAILTCIAKNINTVGANYQFDNIPVALAATNAKNIAAAK